MRELGGKRDCVRRRHCDWRCHICRSCAHSPWSCPGPPLVKGTDLIFHSFYDNNRLCSCRPSRLEESYWKVSGVVYPAVMWLGLAEDSISKRAVPTPEHLRAQLSPSVWPSRVGTSPLLWYRFVLRHMAWRIRQGAWGKLPRGAVPWAPAPKACFQVASGIKEPELLASRG